MLVIRIGLLAIVSIPHAHAAQPRVKPADLIMAAKAASVRAIDQRKDHCGDDRSVERWLTDAVGNAARAIRWSAGRCRLTNKINPIDAGTRWRAQAEIVPQKGGPSATVEFYFDEPKGGRPAHPFAFRALVHTKEGWDYMRETAAFEVNWGETYVPGFKPPDSSDCP